MDPHTRWALFLFTALTVLALSAMWAVPVLAEEEIPPATATPESVAPQEEAPPAEPPPAEEPPVVDTTTEILTTLPEGTEIVVLDENGEPLPMAAEEATELLYSGDPTWCPAGVTPNPLTCVSATSFNGLSGLISSLDGLTVAGTIWIEASYDSATAYEGGPVTLDSAALGSTSDYALTIQGGWLGMGFGSAVDTTDPSEFHVPFTISDWDAAITIQDIVISGVTSGQALTIETSGNISLNRVDVVDNNDSVSAGAAGAHLDNTSDPDGGSGTGNITVSNSEFSANWGGSGLELYSFGTISLANVSANDNGEFGAFIDNDGASLPKNVSLTTGAFAFNENFATALVIFSKGLVSLKDIDAIDNGSGVVVSNIAGSMGVTLTGWNVFAENSDDGLAVYTNGAISASNLVAIDNGDMGVYLDNCQALGDPACNTTTAIPVTLTGTNLFQYNGEGLHIITNGAITLNNVTSVDNWGSFGVWLSNANSAVGANVTMTGSNVISDNATGGLRVLSKGMVTLNNVTARWTSWGINSSLYGYGVYVDNSGAASPKPVVLAGTNDVSGNRLGGLYILSKGAVTLNQITSNYSAEGEGVHVDNSYGSPQNVTINGYGTFQENYGSGLWVMSRGAITLNNINADDNGGYGAHLWNAFAGSTGGVTVANTPTYWPSFSGNSDTGLYIESNGSVVVKDFDAYENYGDGVFIYNAGGTGNVSLGTGRLNWLNGLNDNLYSGLVVYSAGAVTLSNLMAESNGEWDGDSISGYGAYVENQFAAVPKPVTLLGNVDNSFYGNYSGGFYILSKGAITVTNISAGGSEDGDGVRLDNRTFGSPLAPQNVTLNGYGEFYDNYWGNGLTVLTYGAVTLNNLYAQSNGSNGIYVNNATGSQAKPVNIKGYANTYDSGCGLCVLSLGAITIANLDAGNNDVYGAHLQNGLGAFSSPITLTGDIYTTWNYGDGLKAESKGAITFTLTDAWVANNEGYGWYLQNNFPGAVGGVTLTGAENIDFSDNAAYGLLVESRGNISVVNVDAYYNGWNAGGWGVKLNNKFDGATGTVTVSVPTGTNSFGGNYGTGLIVNSNRAITLTNISAWGNDYDGALLDNSPSGPSAPQPVTINNHAHFNGNGDSGLVVATYGAITLYNIEASDNGWNDGAYGWGAYLDNCIETADVCTAEIAKGITLNGANEFYGNWKAGLFAASLGPIKAANVTANGNQGSGARLDNQWGISNQSVILTGMNTFDDNNFGLEVYSNGAITLSNVTANWNFNGGAFLNNESISAATSVPVTLTGVNSFIGNNDEDPLTTYEWGLVIATDGNITLSNLTASYNGADGALLNNVDLAHTPLAPTLTITGLNLFRGNDDNGLVFEIAGTVLLNNIRADGNLYDGVYGRADGNITIACGSMSTNGDHGWSLGSLGDVTLKAVAAYGNFGPSNTEEAYGEFYYPRICP